MRAVVQFLRQSAEPCAAADQSLHGFADGASGCWGTRSPPTLFVCRRLRLPCCSAQRPEVLLIQDEANQSVDLSRFPQLKPLFQFGVPVDTCRDFSEEQAASVAVKEGPELWRRVRPNEFRLSCDANTSLASMIYAWNFLLALLCRPKTILN